MITWPINTKKSSEIDKTEKWWMSFRWQLRGCCCWLADNIQVKQFSRPSPLRVKLCGALKWSWPTDSALSKQYYINALCCLIYIIGTSPWVRDRMSIVPSKITSAIAEMLASSHNSDQLTDTQNKHFKCYTNKNDWLFRCQNTVS